MSDNVLWLDAAKFSPVEQSSIFKRGLRYCLGEISAIILAKEDIDKSREALPREIISGLAKRGRGWDKVRQMPHQSKAFWLCFFIYGIVNYLLLHSSGLILTSPALCRISKYSFTLLSSIGPYSALKAFLTSSRLRLPLMKLAAS